MRTIRFGLITLVILVCSSVSYSTVDSTDLLIGRDCQFFFDTIVIESIRNLTRKVHHSKKLPGPVLKKDKPREHIRFFHAGTRNVILDPQDSIHWKKPEQKESQLF